MPEKQKNELFEWIQAIIIAIILAIIIRSFIVEIFQVEGESMSPTFQNGERIAVSKLNYRFNKPEQGEIVVFKYSDIPKIDYIKRVIATKNDSIEIRNGKVIVNERVLEEEYIKIDTPGNFGPEKVPKNHIFVLGDNRANSKDSRSESVGFVPIENVKGKAVIVVWPIQSIRIIN